MPSRAGLTEGDSGGDLGGAMPRRWTCERAATLTACAPAGVAIIGAMRYATIPGLDGSASRVVLGSMALMPQQQELSDALLDAFLARGCNLIELGHWSTAVAQRAGHR